MMTQATPEGRDFDRDGENPYTPINTKEERAIRKFKEVFGEYFTQDLHFVTREEFFTKYAQYLPPRLFELKDELCNIDYHSKLHFFFIMKNKDLSIFMEVVSYGNKPHKVVNNNSI
jgi:hypothetical protein